VVPAEDDQPEPEPEPEPEAEAEPEPEAERSGDETAVMPAVRPASARPAVAEEETRVLPAVTAKPPVPPAWQPKPPPPVEQPPQGRPTYSERVQDKVPSWLFRPEDEAAQGPQDARGGPRRTPRSAPEDRTHEVPALRPDGTPAGQPRGRFDWAEETPLDDVPTLTDKLFGHRRDGKPGKDADGS
jgi:dTMP kinase